jgi:hypothetical protein
MTENPYTPHVVHRYQYPVTRTGWRFVLSGLTVVFAFVSLALAFFFAAIAIDTSSVRFRSYGTPICAAIWFMDGVAFAHASVLIVRGRYALGLSIAGFALATFLTSWCLSGDFFSPQTYRSKA